MSKEEKCVNKKKSDSDFVEEIDRQYQAANEVGERKEMPDNHRKDDSTEVGSSASQSVDLSETVADNEKNSDLNTADEKKRRSLASNHRSHHHHNHNTHKSDNQNVVNSVFSDTISEQADTEEMAHDTLSDNKSRKRIPLAAHHRSHRHHRSSEHNNGHNSSRHRHHSDGRRLYEKFNKPYTYRTEQNRGKITTVEIDLDDFERIKNETIKEMEAEKTTNGESLNVDRADLSSGFKETAIENTGRLDGNANTNSIETYFDSTNDRDKETGNNPENSAPRLASTILAARELNPRATRKASSVKSSGSRQRRAQNARRATALTIVTRILIGVVILLFGGIGTLLYMRAHGKSIMTPNEDMIEIVIPEEEVPEEVESVEDDGKTIVYKGEKYRWNDNLSTILFIGTDRTVAQQESGETMAGKNGQADTILLGVIDNTNKEISFININRDTFIPVAEYSADGDYAGEKKMQICLSYAYGKDNETSCKYTAAAVSKYLFGMPVDYYVRLSYDAIPMLNDSVGGVTLTVAEDMTKVDASLTEGTTVTLVGNQALSYCRWRDHSIVNTNENRISRQKQFLKAFLKRTIEATRADLTLPLGLYQNAKPYMTTNITASGVTYMTSKVLEYGIEDDAIHGIPGESVLGAEGYVEFYPDQTALYERVLETFYNKVES